MEAVKCFDSILGAGLYHYTLAKLLYNFHFHKKKAENHQKSENKND